MAILSPHLQCCSAWPWPKQWDVGLSCAPNLEFSTSSSAHLSDTEFSGPFPTYNSFNIFLNQREILT